SDQCNRSASGAASNYRAAIRGKSHADFVNKLKIVEEELDESLFFLEMIQEINLAFEEEIKPIYKEGTELISIIVASLRTLRTQYLNHRRLTIYRCMTHEFFYYCSGFLLFEVKTKMIT